ncbi:MAG: radical SAM protein [Peptococcaceae bacterium]
MWSEAKPCPELIWFATNKCPLNCLYCCVGDDKNDDNDKNNKESFELSTLEAKELIRQAADFTQYLVIIGGEPLLREDLEDLLAYAQSLNLPCSIITKGTLITEEWAHAAAKLNLGVNIALDALSPEVCDKLAQSHHTGKKSLRSIEICHRAGILQGITATLTKLNAQETLDLLNFASRLKVEGCWMALRPIGQAQNKYAQLALRGREYEEYLQSFCLRAKEINLQTGLNFYVYDPVYMRVLCQNTDYGNIKSVKNFPLEKKLCGLGRYLNVDAFGNVLACLFTNLTVGNIKEKTLQEIWAEVISSPFFSYLHDPANLKGGCGKCLYNRICGGCRTRAYSLTGDWLAPDPACYLSGTR